MKVLVTGGAGFIGSHLVERLIQRGYEVNVLDNMSTGRRENVPEAATLIIGDICASYCCEEAMDGCEGVFHLAAMSNSAASVAWPNRALEVNVIGTGRLLTVAHKSGVKKVIYAGSSTYYGNQPAWHFEHMKGEFLNLYGLSKYTGEEICLLYDKLYSVPCNVLRYFNVYGPRQPEEGYYALVLGTFLRRAKAGLPLEIHGDGLQRRDFVQVRDVVNATILAYETAQHGKVWNVGSGASISIQELANMISSNQLHTAPRIADAVETLASIGRIGFDLGWRPRIAFKDGLEELKKHYGIGVHSAMHSG